MKKKLLIAVYVILSLSFLHCQSALETEPPFEAAPLRPLTLTETELVRSNQAFSLNLLRAVNRASSAENYMISPLSASMALSMALNGAQGATRDSMRAALNLLQLDSMAMNQSAKSLMALITRLDPKVRIEIANSIWIRDSFPVLPAFTEVNRTYFNAEVATLDFNSPTTLDRINGWVNEKTNGKIPTILDQIPGDVIMYLINALYFKAQWRAQFKPENTRPLNFTLKSNAVKSVQMMNQTSAFGLYESPDITALDLPYGDSLYSMTLIKTNTSQTIESLIDTLSQATLEGWMKALRPEGVNVTIPKWKLEYENIFNNELERLGMGIAFTDFANFKGMNVQVGIRISKVKQKTFIEVNEEGTEAAAVTVVELSRTSLPPAVAFNKPFLYLIRERSTGTILFMGKVGDPLLESAKDQ